MWGIVPVSRPQPLGKELPPLRHSHSAEFYRNSSRNAHTFSLNSNLYMRIYAAVFTMATIIWLIASAWRCRFLMSRGSTSGHRRRRLASGGGQQGEGEGQEPPETCKDLEDLLLAQEGEDSASSSQAFEQTGTSAGASPNEERPRKRKKTTKHEGDSGDLSAEQAKRAREETWDPVEYMKSLIASLEGPTLSSSPAPPFSPEPAEHGGADTLNKLLREGKTTLIDWILDSGNDMPLTAEEEHRPEGSPVSSPLEGTSKDFPYDPLSQEVESQGPQQTQGDTETPSTSAAVSDVQPLSSQPSLPQRLEDPQPSSLLDASAALPRETSLRPFNQQNVTRYLGTDSAVRLLRPIQQLLRKDRLSDEDKQTLISNSEHLFVFVSSHLRRQFRRTVACRLVVVASYRLLIADALWRACDALGPLMMKEEWWGHMMEAIFGNGVVVGKVFHSRDLIFNFISKDSCRLGMLQPGQAA